MPDFHFARYADLLGLKGIRVDKPEQIGAAWDEALSADRPVIIEAVTDPEVPTLPPHITFKEAMNFADSLIHDSARTGHVPGSDEGHDRDLHPPQELKRLGFRYARAAPVIVR